MRANPQKDDEERIAAIEANRDKNEMLYQAIKRHIKYDPSKYQDVCYNSKQYHYSLVKFCFYLINKIEEKDWKGIFEACVPAIRQSYDVLNMLLPYLIYYAMRFNQTDPNLISNISGFINDIFKSQISQHIDQILKAIDFLNVCLDQDKFIFKNFIENETKFRYVEKLFFLDIMSPNTDENILDFIKTLNNFPSIKLSFLLVKKVNKLKQEIDRDARFKGAQKINNFKRCIYNFEENFRQEQSKAGNQGKPFFDILPRDQIPEVIGLYRRVNQQDFNSDFFNNIIYRKDRADVEMTEVGKLMSNLSIQE